MSSTVNAVFVNDLFARHSAGQASQDTRDGTRVPRMTGLPCCTAGSIEMRSDMARL